MATRTAVWQIVADYSRVRKENEKTARSLRDLNRDRKKYVDDATSGDEELDASNKKATRSVKERVANLSRLSREQRAQSSQSRDSSRAERDSAKATDEATRATKNQEGAHRSAEGTLRRLIATRKAHNAAQREDVSQTEAVVRAQSLLQRATLSNEKATLNLTAATRRLSDAEKKHGSDSSQYANALLNVQRRQNDVASAALRMENATKAAANAERQAGSGSGGLSSGLKRVAGGFGEAGIGAKAMGAAMMGIKFGAIIYGIGALASGLSNLAAGALSLIGPLSSLGGVLAAMPQAFSVAAGGIGTFLAAFSGVGAALKAGTAAQASAGKEAVAVGKAEKSSARQVAAAARAIKAAQRQVKQARQNVADTARQNAQALRAADQQVVDSEKAVADAHVAVADARRQARQDILAYTQSLKDLALQERGASLSVEEARRRLNETLIDPGADNLAKAEAKLAYDEALNRLNVVRKEHAKTKKEAETARRKGVGGSDIVIQALDNEKQATRSLADAHRNLADTRRQAARSTVQAAQAVKDAIQGLKDAQQGLRDAQQAGADAAVSAASAQNKYADALAGLSPAQQKFVKLLMGMTDEMHRMRDAAAAGLLPGVGEGLTTLLKLVPLVSNGLYRMGKVIGNAFSRFADLMTSGPFTKMFGNILNSNVRLMRMGGHALTNIAAALVYVMDAATPFTEWLGKTILGWTKFGRASAKAGHDSGAIADGLNKTKSVLKILGGALKNLFKVFKNIGGAGNDLGMDLLRSFRRITRGWAKWTGSVKGQNELKDWFDAARPTLHQLSKLGGALMRMFFDLGKKNTLGPILKQLRVELLPVIKQLLTAFSGDFASSLITALASVGKLVAKLAENGGGFSVFFDTITKVVDVLNSIPSGVLSTLVTALATIAALKFVGTITGFSKATKMGLKAGKTVYGASKKSKAAREKAGDTRTLTQRASDWTSRNAGQNNGGGGSHRRGGGGARKKPRTTMRDRFRQSMANSRSAGLDGGFVNYGAFGGGGRDKTDEKGGKRKAAPKKRRTFRERVSSFGSRNSRSTSPSAGGEDTPRKAGRASKAASSMGRGLGKAAGGATALADALSLIPGPIGEVASKFLMFSGIASMFAPLLSGLKDHIGSIGSAFSKIGGVIGSVVGKIGGVMMKLVGFVGKAMMGITRVLMANPWMLLIAALIVVAILVYKNWDKIKKIVSKAISGIINWVKSHWDIIKWFLGPLAVLITLVVKHWDTIKGWITKKITEILNWVKTNWNKMIGIFKSVHDALSKGAKAVWDSITGAFKTGVDKAKQLLNDLKTGAGIIWDKIKHAFSSPVEFIINRVINDGLIGGYNKIAGFLHTGKIDEINFKGFKKGGIPSSQDTSVYPGYTPGKDVGFIGISGGEAIMRPEWTRAVGAKTIEDMNRTARTGGAGAIRKKFAGNFAQGGIAGGPGVGSLPIPAVGQWSRHTSGYSWARWAGDINVPGSGDYGNPVRAYKSGTVSLATYNGAGHEDHSGSYGRWIKINHPDGSNTLYAHLSEMDVKAGQQVSRGQMIGRVGDFGNAYGPHLHFEIAGGTDPINVGAGGDAGSSGGGLHLPGWMGKIVGNVAGFVKEKVNSGVDKLRGMFPDSSFMDMVAQVPKNMINGFVNKITGKTNTYIENHNPSGVDGPAGGDHIGVAAGGTPAVRRAVQSVASKYGWGSGDQWAALSHIISTESGWDPNAANPSSSARGLFQKMTSIHGAVEGSVEGQTKWGLNYIKDRYGNPSNAWAFHLNHGWYKDGGIVPNEAPAGVGVAGDSAPTQMFARGGKVRGYGNRDTVPAMLTPGEFVIKKDTVERVGVDHLERLNRGGKNKGTATGTQHFHDGGVVLGMREGAHGAWVKALEQAVGIKADGTWGKALTRLLKRDGVKAIRAGAPGKVDMPARRDRALLDWLNPASKKDKGGKDKGKKDDHKHGRTKKDDHKKAHDKHEHKKGDKKDDQKKGTGRTWGATLKHFDIGGRTLFGWIEGIKDQIQKLPKGRTKQVMSSFAEFGKRFNNDNFRALNSKLGVAGSGITDDTRKAMEHVLDHAFGKKHDALMYRPWANWTPLEASIIQADMKNKKTEQWQHSLEQISTWGYEPLLNDLLSKGMDDDGAFNTAIEAAKKQNLAKMLNDKLAMLGDFSDTDFVNLIKMIGFFNSSAQAPGLRDMARHLGLSDYETVSLYEKANKAGRFSNTARTKRSALESDISSYRAGTFYFADGGEVPGTGSGDTVPAMLTPGEFVIKKQAAEALGLSNLLALNGVQKFASGGLVMAPSVSRPPTRSTAGVSAYRLSAQTSGSVTNNVTYDVDIHNPIAEKSTKSLTKALQRQSTLKTSGGSGWKSVGGTS